GGKGTWGVRFSSGRHFSGNKITSKGDVKAAILAGSVYGASYWQRRFSFRSKGDLPEVCYNDKYDKNNLTNVSYVGRFICPTDDTMGNDHTYCCGEEGQQYCCTFWDDLGRVHWAVSGILVLVGVFMIACVYCHEYYFCHCFFIPNKFIKLNLRSSSPLGYIWRRRELKQWLVVTTENFM
ncbi:uncharacterized protein LOC134256192, partial [Saccostrea cucullata]|uniref:uncharacterized protein LOC134256192 n=1 Tax=Saccostrea cuccullata TaxID=36930 RepID=UPI002ED4C51F